MTELDIPSHASLEVKAVWQSLAEAHRHLAELKGLWKCLGTELKYFSVTGSDNARRRLLIFAAVMAGAFTAGFLRKKGGSHQACCASTAFSSSPASA